MSQIRPLLRFYLGNAPWFVWLQFGVYVFWLILLGPGMGFHTLTVGLKGVEQLAGQVMLPAMWTLVLGAFFFGNRSNWNEPSGGIPHAEYLLSRPVTRRTAYGLNTAVYFTLILLPPLLTLTWKALHPDLQVSFLSHQEWSRRELLDWFPLARAKGEALVIPDGLLLVCGWQVSVIILTALVAQVLFLLQISYKARQVTWFGVMGLWFFGQTHPERTYYPLFFAFTEHWPAVVMILLLLFLAAQVFCWKRAGRLEVL